MKGPRRKTGHGYWIRSQPTWGRYKSSLTTGDSSRRRNSKRAVRLGGAPATWRRVLIAAYQAWWWGRRKDHKALKTGQMKVKILLPPGMYSRATRSKVPPREGAESFVLCDALYAPIQIDVDNKHGQHPVRTV